MAFYISIEVSDIEQESTAIGMLDNWQLAALHKPPNLPWADAKVMRSVLGSQ